MPITDAQKRAHEKYFKENYQRLTISYPKDYCEKVKEAAQTAGESLAGYVKKAIDARMESEGDPNASV